MWFEKIKTGAQVLGIGVVLIGGYGSLQPLPQTHVVATVVKVTDVNAAGPKPSVAQAFLNLSLVIKCNGDPGKTCISEIFEFGFPGLSKPELRAADGLQKNIQEKLGPQSLDPQNRQWNVYQILRPLKGGEAFTVNVAINGKIDPTDIKFFTVTGEDVLSKKFECKSPDATPRPISHFICTEKYTIGERFAVLIPFVRN